MIGTGIEIPADAVTLRLALRNSDTVPTHLRGACTKSILFHILYSRGVFPCPAEDVLRRCPSTVAAAVGGTGEVNDGYGQLSAGGEEAVEPSSKLSLPQTAMGVRERRLRQRRRGAVARVERKIHREAERLRSLLDDLDRLLFEDDTTENDGDDDGRRRKRRCGDVKAVSIALGRSSANPKERYLLRFHSWPRTHTTASPGITTAVTDRTTSDRKAEARRKMEHEIGRRSVREFIRGTTAQTAEDPSTAFVDSSCSGGAGTTKVTVSVLLTKDAVDSLFDTERSSFSRCGDGGNENVPPSHDNTKHTATTRPTTSPYHDPVLGYTHGGIEHSNTGGDRSTNRFLIQRRRHIDVNRGMTQALLRRRSKRRRRTFVVLDVVPTRRPTVCVRKEGVGSGGGGDDRTMEESETDGVGFREEDGDTWVSLRSFVKGFRI